MRSPAVRLLQALNPRHRPLTALRTFERFAAEVEAEAGPGVLVDVVRHVEQHAALGRRAS